MEGTIITQRFYLVLEDGTIFGTVDGSCEIIETRPVYRDRKGNLHVVTPVENSYLHNILAAGIQTLKMIPVNHSFKRIGIPKPGELVVNGNDDISVVTTRKSKEQDLCLIVDKIPPPKSHEEMKSDLLRECIMEIDTHFNHPELLKRIRDLLSTERRQNSGKQENTT